MKDLTPGYRQLVLVCDNRRPPGSQKPSCGDHGSTELRGWLKKRLKEEGRWGATRVLLTGCLDVCPNKGVVCSFDRGETLKLVDAEGEREAVLERILQG